MTALGPLHFLRLKSYGLIRLKLKLKFTVTAMLVDVLAGGVPRPFQPDMGMNARRKDGRV